jgi:hypothetical protein
MPIQYKRDDAGRRAEIVIKGPFNSQEILDCVEQHRMDGGWTYGLLYDLRYMTGEPTRDTLREFAVTMARRPGEPARGPVAILVSQPALYSLACTYAAMARAHATIEVFRDRDEAESWLRKNI